MNIRGWVYLITNKAMPGLVKIGYSTKDPQLRAQELGGTSVPHPFVVEADFLCINPRETEQMVHIQLAEYREGKEWFRCSLDTAKHTILRYANSIDKISPNSVGNNLSANVKNSFKPNDISSDHHRLISLFIPSLELGAIIGCDPITKDEANEKICAYIEKHNLQHQQYSRMINADVKLKKLSGKDYLSMFEMTKIINEHLKESQSKINIASNYQGMLPPIYIPSLELGAIIGGDPITRNEATKRIWSYIKKYDLQDHSNRRMINADAKLKKIFKKDQASMFEMTNIINGHLKEFR